MMSSTPCCRAVPLAAPLWLPGWLAGRPLTATARSIRRHILRACDSERDPPNTAAGQSVQSTTNISHGREGPAWQRQAALPHPQRTCKVLAEGKHGAAIHRAAARHHAVPCNGGQEMGRKERIKHRVQRGLRIAVACAPSAPAEPHSHPP